MGVGRVGASVGKCGRFYVEGSIVLFDTNSSGQSVSMAAEIAESSLRERLTAVFSGGSALVR